MFESIELPITFANIRTGSTNSFDFLLNSVLYTILKVHGLAFDILNCNLLLLLRLNTIVVGNVRYFTINVFRSVIRVEILV